MEKKLKKYVITFSSGATVTEEAENIKQAVRKQDYLISKTDWEIKKVEEEMMSYQEYKEKVENKNQTFQEKLKNTVNNENYDNKEV